jgi:hypothetical protein
MATASTERLLPTFLGIGAQKSGTTSVHQYLLSHPQIFLPARKELRFFPHECGGVQYRGPGDEEIPSRVVDSWPAYVAAFRGSGKFAARGEISPEYLLLAERAAPRIAHYLPQVKLFAVLRNPADRAYSNFLQAVRMGREPRNDFSDALSEEESRIRKGWSPLFWYRRNGEYARQLREFYARFPRDHIRIYLFEDLLGDAAGMMADLFRFLEVDPGHRPDVSMRFHPSGVPRGRALFRAALEVRRCIRWMDGVVPAKFRNPLHAAVRDGLLRPAPPMPSEAREALMESYREEIDRLQGLIRRDLRAWTGA